jgi:hypothetical protein
MVKQSVPKLFLSMLFYLIFAVNCFSQDEPKIEFGEFSVDEFKDTLFMADSSASAIIIYDLGKSYFNKSLEIEYTRHMRIKILKKAGYHWATVKIPFKRGSGSETIKEIKGLTAILNDKGEIVINELNSENIFEEQIDKNLSMKNFSLPALQPNCIIEFYYKVKSEYLNNFPRKWYFQHEDPVLWSEYETDVPSMYGFAVFEQKTQPFYINEVEKFNKQYTPWETDQVNLFLSGFKKRMVMRNVPALREEPYVKSFSDYRTHVTYQLAAYTPPFSSSRKNLQTWEELGTSLIKEDKFFGGRLDGTSMVEKLSMGITDSIPDKDGKVLKIFDYVKNAIVWTGDYSIYASELDEIIGKKKGDGGDINLLLGAMLKSIGLEVHPIILSTRDNGTVYTKYPFINQFNHVIIYVRTDKNEFVLDATDRFRPFYLLPLEAFNDLGLMIFEDKVEWVAINPAGKDLSVKVASVLIQNNGAIEGLMRITEQDYAAVSARHKIENLSNEEYLKKVLREDKTGFKGTSIKVSDKEDFYKPLVIDSNINSTSYSQVADNMIYVDPCFLGKIENNPFKSETRSYPVDYGYPIDHYYKVNITLPDGYVLKEYPKSVSVNLVNEKNGYVREVVVSGNLVQYSTRFFIDKISFSPEEYSELRKFYDKVISLEAEPLVLQKGI